MISISNGIKRMLNSSVHLLNQSIVKENIKNIAGSVTFVFGLVEIYDVYQIARGREISTERDSVSSEWIQAANKVVVICAKISLILSAGVSRPGIFIISSLVGRVLSTDYLERVFGPNKIFTVNPWHPRHIISIVAVIFALPSVLQSAYTGINWLYKKIRHHQNGSINRQNADNWLTDSKMQSMVLFNTITSRPILHVGNQLSRFILRL